MAGLQTSTHGSRECRRPSNTHSSDREKSWSYPEASEGKPKPACQKEGKLRESKEKGQVHACCLFRRTGCAGRSLSRRKDGYFDNSQVEAFLGGSVDLMLSSCVCVSLLYTMASSQDNYLICWSQQTCCVTPPSQSRWMGHCAARLMSGRPGRSGSDYHDVTGIVLTIPDLHLRYHIQEPISSTTTIMSYLTNMEHGNTVSSGMSVKPRMTPTVASCEHTVTMPATRWA